MRAQHSFLLLLVMVPLVLSPPAFSQEKKKEEEAKRAVLDALHPAPKEGPAPVKLLPGYRHKSSTNFEAIEGGEIWKAGGLKIEYSAGPTVEPIIEPKEKGKYIWYREQVISGREVRCALTAPNELVVTFSFGSSATNFYAEVKKPEDIAEMLLIVLTYLDEK